MVKQAETPEDKTLVSNAALAEINVDICDSLKATISLTMEATVADGHEVAHLLQPIVTRLKSICEENDFPE